MTADLVVDPATSAIRESSEIVARARAHLADAESARDRVIRDALTGGMTGAAVAAATVGTGAEIREMRVSQIRRGVRA